MLLLRGGGSGSLDLSVLLGDQGGVLLLVLRVWLALVVVLVLVLLLMLMLQPRGVSLGVLVLVGKNVLALRLEHGEGASMSRFGDLEILRRVGLRDDAEAAR